MSGFYRLSVFCAAVLGWGVAQGDAIYWLLGQDARYEPVQFAYAQMVDAANPNHVYTVADAATAREIPDAEFVLPANPDAQGLGTTVGKTAMYLDPASGWESASFYIQLYGEDWTEVGQSAIYDFKSLDGYIFKGNNLEPGQLAPTAFAITIPEPTGGMLVLLGVAALALRRRGEKILKKN